LAEVYVSLTEEAAPTVINGPIRPTAAVTVAVPPTIEPNPIDEEAWMKESAVKADESRMRGREARAKSGMKAHETRVKAYEA
jgi:hypothetical protein